MGQGMIERNRPQLPRRHVVISGTGRSGTSFLVELLTHLGLDTGYRVETLEQRKSKLARAGLEHDVRDSDAPFIVKNPSFCEYAEEVFFRDDIVVEHVFIPMRDLKAAVESRRFVTNHAVANMSLFKRFHFYLHPKHVSGGLTSDVDHQEEKLLHQIYQLSLALSRTSIPVTLMRYPLLVQDASYLYSKLEPILEGISFTEFESAFSSVARQDLVHSYSETDR